MNKEVLVAIIIGVSLGIIGALYFSNVKPSTSPKRGFSITSTQITPRDAVGAHKLASLSQLPENGSIVLQSKLRFKGKAGNDSALLIGNRLTIEPIPVRKGKFNHEFTLKPGTNEIVLFELNADKEQLKVLKLYYLALVNQTEPKEETVATEEADILKHKLEQKVLELRSKPSRVVNGAINSINDKQIMLKSGMLTNKIIVEPEITNFYRVVGHNLEEIAFHDLAKGDEITSFVSDIGGDEISYTVYQEPAQTIAAGKISNLDADNYQVTILDFDKSSFGADLELQTIQNIYDLKAKKIVKSGFSKLAIGQRIIAILSGQKGDYSIDEYLVLQ